MQFNRRQVIAAAGALFVPSRAPGQPRQQPERDPRFHTIPEFGDIERDLDQLLVVAGWRPHRQVNGVARLRLDFTSPRGPDGKKIVYNYGHSGGGVTLCLGCGKLIEEHFASRARTGEPRVAKSARIVVVGAGVVGLATAFVLREEGYSNVEIIADRVASGRFDHPQIVSDIAGGQFDAAGIVGIDGNIVPRNSINSILRRSLEVLTRRRNQANDPFRRPNQGFSAYIAVRNYTTDPARVPGDLREASQMVEALGQDITKDLGANPALSGDLTGGAGVIAPFPGLFASGVRFGGRTTLLINTSSFITAIKDELGRRSEGRASVPINEGLNGRRLRGARGGVRVSSYEQLLGIEADVVIVCAGLGSSMICEDDSGATMIGAYGLLARAPKIIWSEGEARYLYSGLGYMFPRSDGTIFGGAWDSGALAKRGRRSDNAAANARLLDDFLVSVRVGDPADRGRADDMVRAVISLLRNDCVGLRRSTERMSGWFNGYNRYGVTAVARACGEQV